MAIRQYIGARYVPRFTGLYDATRIYDALDVVDNGSGTSYIAKKTVPAGTVLTDTEYWFVYGASSGAILDLQNRMTGAENDIDGLENDVTLLNAEIANFKKLNIVLVSDSYGNPAFSGGHSWMEYLENELGGRTVTSYWQGGSGFGWDSSDPLYFPTFFNTFTADNDVDMVLILTGANDGNLLYLNQTTEGAIIAGLNDGINVLHTKYPNAKIHLGFIGRYKQPARYPAYKQARDIYRKTAIGLEIVFADNFEYVLHQKSLLDNGDVHPTAAGQRKIANFAFKYIQYGYINVNEEYLSPDTVGTIGGGFEFVHIIHNGVSIVTPKFNGSNQGNIALNKTIADSAVVMTFEAPYASDTFNAMVANEGSSPGSYTYNPTSGTPAVDVYLAPVNIHLYNGKLTMNSYKRYNQNGGLYTDLLTLMPTIVFDSMDC